MTNPFVTHGEQQWAKFHAAQKNAYENGLVMVSLSPRRSIVVQFGGTVNGEPPRSFFAGSIVFGPRPWSECMDFIKEKLREKGEDKPA